MHSNRKGKNKFRKIEITKVDKSTESDVSDTFEESENVETDEPCVPKEPENNEIRQLKYYSDTDQFKIPDVTDMVEEFENVDKPIETENNEELIVRMAGEPEIRQGPLYKWTENFTSVQIFD